MDRTQFVSRYGGVFEHSPWIAEETFDHMSGTLPEDSLALLPYLVATLRKASHQQQRDLILAHPDLAGKLALAGELTDHSRHEQSSSGLDRLTVEELRRFTQLNDRYKQRFGFPFVMAVKGADKAQILANFEQRLSNSPDEEFATALAQVEKIALFRLQAMHS